MSKSFEDELMELQSEMISLGMDVTRGKADYIFIYCSNERGCSFFNAFFAINGKLTELHELEAPERIQWRFLDLGQAELNKLDALGAKHNVQVPTEMKMGYQVGTGKFKATYKYEPVCVGGVMSEDVYERWMAQVKKGFKLL